jgi:hypothetical protein
VAASLRNIPVRAFPALGYERLAIGLGQGVVFWLLYRAAQWHAWPATQPRLFVPLLLVVMFVPILALAGLGVLRRLTLVLWLACAVLVLIVVGLHEVARNQAPAVAIADLEPRSGAVIGALALAMAGAGCTLDVTLALAKLYALRNSSNYGTRDQLGWIKREWRDGKSGRWG